MNVRGYWEVKKTVCWSSYFCENTDLIFLLSSQTNCSLYEKEYTHANIIQSLEQ